MATQKKLPRGTNRDSFDARDLIYRPSLINLPEQLLPDWSGLHILDQKQEGACTGFGLAALINYLLHQRRADDRVSARMLFEMARRYDQWAGNNYDWSSARGAMKGWYKHGVCSQAVWPNHKASSQELTAARQQDALRYPLGAYYRVLPHRNDLMAALNETGVAFAAAATHDGWDAPDRGRIVFDPQAPAGTGHAFAIVGYTATHLIVQNSWGRGWGGAVLGGQARAGLALWSHEDFERNVWDLWVARLALPVESLGALRSNYTMAGQGSRRTESGPPPSEVSRHLIHIDDGGFDHAGDYPSTEASARELIDAKIDAAKARGELTLLMYAHGGLNSVDDVARRTRKWRDVIDGNRLEHFHWMWETGFMAELKDVVFGKDKFSDERAGGPGDWKDKLLEKLTRALGKALWSEMKDDAQLAFRSNAQAGARVLQMVGEALTRVGGIPQQRLTLCGHSAGAIWVAHLLEAWHRLVPDFHVDQVVLLAPACRVSLFESHIAPHALAGRVGKVTLMQLPDEHERKDNVARVYGKSLLYYVSNACEEREGVTPILGMQRFNPQWSATMAALKAQGRLDLVTATVDQDASRATTHGGFDNDVHTMNRLLAIALGGAPAQSFRPEDLRGY
jgi:Papain family cysteine protease